MDLETTINSEKHGPAAKDPVNDFHTIIYGQTSEDVHVVHNKTGFEREPNAHFFRLLDETDLVVGHNLPFDLSYIWNNNKFKMWVLEGGRIWDTQLAEYLMSGQRHAFPSLGELQRIYLGTKIKEDRISKLYKKGIGADRFLSIETKCPRLFNLYDKYARDDGETTIKIYHEQVKRAEKLGMTKIIRLFNDYLLSLIQCMNTGIVVDKIKCEHTLRDFKVKSIELLQKAQQLIEPYWADPRLPEFNVNSPTHKSALLFGGEIKCVVREHVGQYKNGKDKFKNVEYMVEVKGFGLPLSLTKESKVVGRYQTGSDVIKKIVDTSDNETAIEYCKLQVEAMNIHKMANTYLEAFLSLDIKNRLYPNFNITKTATSRLSSSNPNLQNVPSKGPMAKAIQGCFVAPEGWKCVQIDFSQLEIYVVAWLSGDEKMTKDLLSGVDFHCLRLSWASSLAQNKTYEEIYDLSKVQEVPEWSLKRSKAKTISYQKAYGASYKSLARTTGLEEDLVKEIFDKEDKIYWRVKGFNDHVFSQVEQTAEPSHANHIPEVLKKGGVNGKRFNKEGFELLPIQQGDKIHFDESYSRHCGYYQSVTGKRYAFEEYARVNKDGSIRVGFSPTQTKNYQIQGTASDIQAVTSAALLPLLLKHSDKVQFINEIHDSKWFYVKEEFIDLIVPKLCAILEATPALFKKYLGIEMPFHVPVDAEIGDNFAELQTYNRRK